jgi:hypothetical protein
MTRGPPRGPKSYSVPCSLVQRGAASRRSRSPPLPLRRYLAAAPGKKTLQPCAIEVRAIMSSKQIGSVIDGPGSAEEKLSAIRSLVAEASSGKSREKIATMSSEVRDDNPYR